MFLLWNLLESCAPLVEAGVSRSRDFYNFKCVERFSLAPRRHKLGFDEGTVDRNSVVPRGVCDGVPVADGRGFDGFLAVDSHFYLFTAVLY